MNASMNEMWLTHSGLIINIFNIIILFSSVVKIVCMMYKVHLLGNSITINFSDYIYE